ncbi:hypothetical protein ACTL6P_11510 [Endozoicomonas acroporae]|uniref:hypothetical protein n=1 Tax=Endozoicomonas acroporae TaxID=1701104 RepID=UPI000C75FCCE|nr:hypothetical protein [Endozoicomonas acroporae]
MMHEKLLLPTLLLVFSSATASELKPFVSDGCSLFPNGTLSQPDQWLHCCVSHDFTYWQGGTEEGRLHSDQALRQCLRESGHPRIGAVMYAGVRFGGSPLWPTPFRWGFGWEYPRLYRPLSSEELYQVETLSRQMEIIGKE